MENFEFIADQAFRHILVRDYQELQECVKNKTTKSILILSGSIIEATLMEFFTHNLPSETTMIKLLKMDLFTLIELAESSGLISSETKGLSIVVKNFRNLIHPGREIRTQTKFDFETANISNSLVSIILKEIKENYIKKYGYKAEDIFQKMETDSSTISIYEELLKKLNNHEKLDYPNY